MARAWVGVFLGDLLRNRPYDGKRREIGLVRGMTSRDGKRSITRAVLGGPTSGC
ncbi:MAG: hypothetical protein WBY94_27625 [Polyangiaceae bacterium]